MAKPLYDFFGHFRGVDDNKEKFKIGTEAEAFAVTGGIQRKIWKDLRDNVNEADIMSEFYEARHFHNMSIQKPIDRSSLIIERIYSRKLTFSFNFTVAGLSVKSSFKYLVLRADDARILDPPRRDAGAEGIKVVFSNPRIIYWHIGEDGKEIQDSL